jgi:hypothetical protein
MDSSALVTGEQGTSLSIDALGLWVFQQMQPVVLDHDLAILVEILVLLHLSLVKVDDLPVLALLPLLLAHHHRSLKQVCDVEICQGRSQRICYVELPRVGRRRVLQGLECVTVVQARNVVRYIY